MARRMRWVLGSFVFFGVASILAGSIAAEPGTVLASFVVSAPLNDVQVFPKGEIVAVGNLDSLHVDGHGRSQISQPNVGRSQGRIGFLRGVWGASPNNVWAVTPQGKVLYWNGEIWSIVDSGDHVLLDVWGSSPTDIFAVGKAGSILRWNGEHWAPMESGTDEILTRIWGSSGRNVYAVGEHGTVLRYDGSIWRRVRVPSDMSFDMISGTGDGDVFVAGWGGSCLHYDGKNWKEIDLGTRGVQDLVASGQGQAWAVTLDEGVLRFDGRNWSRGFELPAEFYANHLAMGPDGALVIAGYHGDRRESGSSGASVTSRDGALMVMATGAESKVDQTRGPLVR